MINVLNKLNKLNKSSLFQAAIFSGMIFNFVPWPNSILYYGIPLLIFFILSHKGETTFDFSILVFVFICFVSILTSQAEKYFYQYERFLGFVVILVCLSSLFKNGALVNFRLSLFTYVFYLLIAVTIISFIGSISGFYVIEDIRGGLIGASRHSMSLGTFAGLTLIFSLKQIIDHSQTVLKKYVWVAILIISILTIFISGARSALISAIIGSLFFLVKYFRNDKKRLFNVLMATVFILIATSSFWLAYTTVMDSKMNRDNTETSLTSSRDGLWNDRINEFISSPLLGVGFGSIDVSISKDTPFNKITGTLEPGSSWLFLLSSTGLFGFFSFLFLLISKMIRIYTVKNDDSFNSFILGILIFFTIHMFAEGYLLSCGELTFCLFWLTIGINYRKENYNMGHSSHSSEKLKHKGK